MKGLTKRQQDIVSFIQEFITKNQFSPSYREIQAHFGFSSLGTIQRHIQVLKRKGILSLEKKASRSITIIKENVKGGESVIELPFIGLIKAGSPIETFSKMQTAFIPSFLVPRPDKTYVLRAQGDSLLEEQICNGDLLLIEARQEASGGEIIVALVNHHDTIIKRYYLEGPYVRLEGNISSHQPIILKPENILIQGVLVGLLRLYTI